MMPDLLAHLQEHLLQGPPRASFFSRAGLFSPKTDFFSPDAICGGICGSAVRGDLHLDRRGGDSRDRRDGDSSTEATRLPQPQGLLRCIRGDLHDLHLVRSWDSRDSSTKAKYRLRSLGEKTNYIDGFCLWSYLLLLLVVLLVA